MTLASNSAATAKRLLSKYGRTVVVKRVTVKGSYDSATGKTSAPTVVTVNAKGYASDMQSGTYRNLDIQIKAGDKMLLIAAKDFSKPELGDTFTIGTNVYTIVPLSRGGAEIVTVEVSGVPVLYKIHGRMS